MNSSSARTTLIDHAGHKFDFVRGVANAFREEVLSSLVPLQDTHVSVTTAVARVKDSKKEIRDQGADIATTITQSFKKLRMILDNREQVLLQQAQEEDGCTGQAAGGPSIGTGYR